MHGACHTRAPLHTHPPGGLIAPRTPVTSYRCRSIVGRSRQLAEHGVDKRTERRRSPAAGCGSGSGTCDTGTSATAAFESATGAACQWKCGPAATDVGGVD